MNKIGASRNTPVDGPAMREISIGESALLTDLAMCVNYFRLFSPGLYCCVHAPLSLDGETTLRPDLLVMVNHGALKQCDPGPDYDCFRSPPNFVLDVFPNSGWEDYDRRQSMYERAGVLEYVAVQDADPLAWRWNRLTNGRFEPLNTPEGSMIFSSALPGMWVPVDALLRRDWWSIMAAIARGVTRVEHHDFMETIWKPGRKRAE